MLHINIYIYIICYNYVIYIYCIWCIWNNIHQCALFSSGWWLWYIVSNLLLVPFKPGWWSQLIDILQPRTYRYSEAWEKKTSIPVPRWSAFPENNPRWRQAVLFVPIVARSDSGWEEACGGCGGSESASGAGTPTLESWKKQRSAIQNIGIMFR